MSNLELIKIAEDAFYESKSRTYAGSAAKVGLLSGLITGALVTRQKKPTIATGIAYGIGGSILGGLLDRKTDIEGGTNKNV